MDVTAQYSIPQSDLIGLYGQYRDGTESNLDTLVRQRARSTLRDVAATFDNFEDVRPPRPAAAARPAARGRSP